MPPNLGRECVDSNKIRCIRKTGFVTCATKFWITPTSDHIYDCVISLLAYSRDSYYLMRRVRNISKGDHWIRHVHSSVRPSIYPSAWNSSAHTGRISMKLYIWGFFENLSRKIEVSLKSDKKSGYFVLYTKINIGSWSYLAEFFVE